jgi:glycopeptide antibiotics resistance protein
LSASRRYLLAASLYLALLLPWLVTELGRWPHPRAYLLEWRMSSPARLTGDAIFNVAMFVPLGWLLARGIEGTGAPARARVIIVAAACAALSFTVETAQFFLMSRYSSVIDIVTNTGGAVAGALVARWRRV